MGMRGPRILLVLCLAVGLLAVWYAAQAQLREVRFSLVRDRQRTVRAELQQRARELARELRLGLETGPVFAYYDMAGWLLWPAAPAVAKPYRAPQDSSIAVFLRMGRVERALEVAQSSRDRTAALVRLGMERNDARLLRRALGEGILQGTDLGYRVRLEIFRLEGSKPDAKWIDDVSALLDGPSDRFGRSLLKEAGCQPVHSRALRAELEGIKPRPGFFALNDHVHSVRVEPEPGGKAPRLVLRRIAVASVPIGSGSMSVQLPRPFEVIELRGDVHRSEVQAALNRWTLRILGLFGSAGLVLIIGTIYAYIALGRAYRLAAAKNDFVANVTHELKTPLANIRLYAESLREGRVRSNDQPEFLDTILEEAGRLDSLVEGLLHAARGPKLDWRPLDIAALTREAETRWRPRLEREGYAFTVAAPAVPAVRGDKEALLRALDNLLDNARKYSMGDRRIRLEASAGNGHVRVTVKDHGPGIPAQDRNRVLRPFARLESADRKETPGTGLGLSLVVSCMEAHGGRIEIGEMQGGGAAVTLILPVKEKS